jgi:hypothetical protein
LEQGENPEENGFSEKGAAAGAAVGARNDGFDADLQSIIERWPALSDAVKVGILAMVKSASGSKTGEKID